ncbi:hypothetical protein WICPIJ_004785 [Wickerhamomyces pijperi]|uniref:Uncharacterized protein n=1 Tax=Wickerhamomyces pijperi TaxID=599730 RepID=A0A9P8TLQ0_WICPI|nr:hypothetical protein WICPIJ_004785 [Wickerhamomyces pijperi]
MSITPGAASAQIHLNRPPRSELPSPTSASTTSVANLSNSVSDSLDSSSSLTSSSNSAAKDFYTHDINVGVTNIDQQPSPTPIPVLLDPSNSSSTVKPRSKSKRASSTNSESERNKFRSRLEMFTISSSAGNEEHNDMNDIKMDLAHSTVLEEEDDDDDDHDEERKKHQDCILPSNDGNFTTRASNVETSHVNPRQYSDSSLPIESNDNVATDISPPTITVTREVSDAETINKITESKISPLTPQLELLRFNSVLDLSCGMSAKKITLHQYKALMNWQYTHPIPDCSEMFPWLHGLDTFRKEEFLHALENYTSVTHDNSEKLKSGNSIPSSYRGLIPVRSCPIQTKTADDPDELQYHSKSGILRGSCEISEILSELEITSHRLVNLQIHQILSDLQSLLQPDQENMNDFYQLITKDCRKLGLVPVLKSGSFPNSLSLRNFKIQVSKISQISDFVVYCFNDDHGTNPDQPTTTECSCASAARLLYLAQLRHSRAHPEIKDCHFSTVVIDKPDLSFFSSPHSSYLLNIDKALFTTTTKKEGSICSEYDISSFVNWDSNYLLKEKLEISKMTSATKIGDHVWMGNSTDIEVLKAKGYQPDLISEDVSNLPLYINPKNSTVGVTERQLREKGEVGTLVNAAKQDWKLLLNCCDGHGFPDMATLKRLMNNNTYENEYVLLNFPPSGSVGMGDCSDSDLMSILNTCKLIYTKSTAKRPTLIYCSDGYTESSLLGMCYLIYATGRPLTECLVDLHSIHGRPFFLFPTDITLISRIEDILIQSSPLNVNDFDPLELQMPPMKMIYTSLFSAKEENWCTKVHGSLPSRVLSHLYLGSLAHAESVVVLEKLGITRVVSVGEEVDWLKKLHSTKRVISQTISVNENFLIPDDSTLKFPVKQLMTVSNIQDDGIDQLTSLLPSILNFIDDCYKANEKVLVHCRVGVSRSATVCIAEVMKRLNLSLIRSYFYVRVRRLNIIIQPNLRFFYELVKWEENQRLLKMRDEQENNKYDDNASNNSKLGTVGSVRMKKNKLKYNESISSLTSVDSLLRSSVDLENISINNQMKISMVNGNGNISPIANGTTCDESLEDEDDVFYDGRSYDEHDIYGTTASTSEPDVTDQTWLRDVDWHVLCRQIDQLNRAYIRGN